MRGLHKKKTNAFILVSTVLICFLSTFINISGYYTNTELTENTFEITNANAYIFENKNNPPSLLFYLDNQYAINWDKFFEIVPIYNNKRLEKFANSYYKKYKKIENGT